MGYLPHVQPGTAGSLNRLAFTRIRDQRGGPVFKDHLEQRLKSNVVVWFLEKRVDAEFVCDFDQFWIPGTRKHYDRDHPALGMSANPAQEFRSIEGAAAVVGDN